MRDNEIGISSLIFRKLVRKAGEKNEHSIIPRIPTFQIASKKQQQFMKGVEKNELDLYGSCIHKKRT